MAVADPTCTCSERTLLLHGAETVDLEDLELFMGSRGVSKRNKPECVKRFDATGLVAVTYKDLSVAQAVQQKGTLELVDTKITVNFINHPRSIEVYNIPSSVSQDILDAFMENTDKSGGGPIDRIDFYDRASNVAVITFEKEAVAERLLFRPEPVQLKGQELLFSPRTTDIDPREVFVTGIVPGTHKQMVQCVFEDRGDIDRLTYESSKGECVITFKDEQVAAQLIMDKKLTYKGTEFHIQRKCPTLRLASSPASKAPEKKSVDPRVIIVTGDKINSTEYLEDIESFFQKKKIGGDIAEAKLLKKGKGAVLTFKDPTVASKVVAQKQFPFDGSMLQVCTKSETAEEEDDDTNKAPKKPEDSSGQDASGKASGQTKCRDQKDGKKDDEEDKDEEGDEKEEAGRTKKTVVVAGIQPGTHQDFLSLYFSNEKKSGGGDITKLEYNSTVGEAEITFGTKKVADRVINHGEGHRLRGTKLIVSPFKAAKDATSSEQINKANKQRSVYVSGIAPTTEELALRLFFESDEVSGEADLEQLDYQPQHSRCTLVYKEDKAAKMVLGLRTPLILEGATLSVSHTPPKPPKPRKPPTKCKPRLKVEGVPSGVTVDYLTNFFELERYSGGGPTDTVDYTEGSGTAVIQFTDPTVVDRVVSRNVPLQIENATLTVSRFEGSQDDAMTVLLVTGISCSTREFGLRCYFERTARGPVKNLVFDEENRTARIQFEDPTAMARLTAPGQELTLDGAMLAVSQETTDPTMAAGDPDGPCQVLVQGFEPTTTQDVVSLFFKSKHRSGGGPLSVEEYDSRKGTARLCFNHKSDAERVLQKREFTLGNTTVSVSLWVSTESRQVLVTGLTRDTQEMTVQMFFEAEKHSGGGDIEDFQFDANRGEALITYKLEEVAKRVLSSTTKNLGERQVSVCRPPALCPSSPADGSMTCGAELVLDDVPGETTRHELTSFFTNAQRSGGGPIQSLKYTLGAGTATVTFLDSKRAHQVLQKSPFNIFGGTVSARWPGVKPKISSRVKPLAVHAATSHVIEIQNLPQNAKQSEIRRAFQSCGGGIVEDLKIDYHRNTALLRFKESSDGAGVLDGGLVVNGVRCPAIPLYQAENAEILGIQVQGLPQNTDDYIVGLYFSNFSGGTDGNMGCDVFINPTSGLATVTCDSTHTVQDILQKQAMKPLIFQSTTIKVKRMQHDRLPRVFHGKSEPRTFVIHGAMETALGELNDYLCHTPSQCEAEMLLYGIDQRTMLFICANDQDHKELLVLCTTRPLKDQMVAIETVPRSRTVIVYKAAAKRDQLRNYFEGQNRSGGGPIRELKEVNENFLITYEKATVADKVASRRLHKVGGTSLAVKKYHASFDDASSMYDSRKPWSYIPDPFYKKMSSPNILFFLTKSEAARDLVQVSARKSGLYHVNWQESTANDGLKVYCTEQQGTVTPLKRSQQIWEDKCSYELEQDLELIESRSIATLDEVYQDILDMAEKQAAIHRGAIAVRTQRDQATVTIVGWKDNIRVLAKQLNEDNKRLVDKITREKDSIINSITLESHQTELLTELNFLDRLQNMFPDITIKLEQGALKMKGLADQIQNAKGILFEEVMNAITVDEYDSASCKKLLDSDPVKEYLQRVFTNDSLVVALRPSSSGITVYAMSQDKVKQAKSIIQKHVVCEEIKLNEGTRPVLQSPQWNDLLVDLKSRHKGLCHVEDTGDKIVIACTELVRRSVIQDVTFCLDSNALVIETLQMLVGEARLLTKDGGKHVRAVKQNFISSVVEFKHTKDGIKITASRQVFGKVKSGLEDIARRILTHDYDLKRSYVAKFFQSSKGTDAISDVERKHEVTCEFIDSTGASLSNVPGEDSSSGAAIGKRYGASSKPKSIQTMEGITVQLVKGSIADQLVDAILNTPKEHSHMKSSAVSEVLHKAGGSAIQEEFKKKAPKGIKFGEVEQTGPGQLAAKGVKAIYHAPCAHWGQGKNGEEKTFRKMMLVSLESAADDDMRSIAIPAIGTGKLKWPRDLIPKLMYEEINNFSRRYPTSNLKEVKIVLYEKDLETVKAFESFLESLLQEQDDTVGSSPDTDQASLPSNASISQSSRFHAGPTRYSLATQEGLIITVKKGSIPKENCDAIINTTSKDLNLKSSGVSLAILSACTDGGRALQDECSRAAHNGIDFGQVLTTSGSSLSAQTIYHGAFPDWDGTAGNALKILSMFLQECLKKASQARYTSIAVPAIGTGNLSYPRDQVAQTMFDEIETFSQKNPRSTLKDIRIVLYQADTKSIQAFEGALDELAKPITDASAASAGGYSPRTTPSTSRDQGAMSASKQDEDEQPTHTGHRRLTASKSGSQLVSHFTEVTPDRFEFSIPPLKVVVEEGDITKATTQAIVNSTNNTLDTTQGGVARAIMSAAGDSVKQECKQYIAQNGTIQVVAKTSGGNMSCDYILHIYIEKGHQIQKAISDVLLFGEASQIKSITFPALGTGQLHVPTRELTKIMVTAFREFGQINPKDLTEIYVRVFQKSVLDDFRETIKEIANSGATDNLISGSSGTAMMMMTRPVLQLTEVANDRLETTVDGVNVVVLKGDLTKQKTEAIVNSTNTDLDLGQGGVSAAILNAGGKRLSKELTANKPKGKPGERIVTSGGKMSSIKHVIHLVAPTQNDHWAQMVSDTLEYADNNSISSLAFPALGTGNMHYPADEMSHMMLSTIKQFIEATRPQTLKQIHIVVFSADHAIYTQFKSLVTARTEKRSIPLRIKDKIQQTFMPARKTPSPPVTPVKTMEDLILRIYAMRNEDLVAATAFIDDKRSELTSNHTFDKPDEIKLIVQLHREQVSHITSLAANLDIELDMELDPNSQPHIAMKGAHRDVIQCTNEINTVLRQAQSQKQAEKQAKILYKQVKWEHENQAGFFVPYPEEISYKIETAHEDKQDVMEWVDSSGVWRVDYNTMTATLTGSADPPVKIRRTMEGSSMIALPKTWTSMTRGRRYELIDLAVTDPGYNDVQKRFRLTCQNPIVKVQRVQCAAQYQSYMVKKGHMTETCPPGTEVERILFHGTTADVIESINTSGFNRSYCGKNAVRFGRGVYFATNASYSAQSRYANADGAGHRFMYVCRVLTGVYTQGKQGMIVPPPRDPKDPNILFDSVVDKMNNMDMFVVFYDTQAYPEYLITFK